MKLKDFYRETVDKNDTFSGGWSTGYYGVLTNLINEKGFKQVAEIGIGYGTHAKHILKNSSVETLYLVDPTRFYPDDAFAADIMNTEPEKQNNQFNELYALIQNELSPWSERTRWLRCPSLDVSSDDISDNSLDCVFIDGDHSYRAVLDDLEFWYKKVKPGGYILGDDYHMEQVSAAVHMFQWKRQLSLDFLIKEGTDYKIFQFIKPLKEVPIVYELENRCHYGLYHWFLLMLAGLRHLESDEKPIIYMPWYSDSGYQNDSLKYFEDKFTFITSLDISGAIIAKFHGEPLIKADTLDTGAYKYIRSIFLKGKQFQYNPKRFVYTTRKNCDKLLTNDGILKKVILNEDEVCKVLSKYGFEYVQLEEYSLEKKIELFQTSAIIISPNSGALSMATFANSNTKIVEIITDPYLLDRDHYNVLCKALHLKYYKFSKIDTYDSHFNMVVNCEALDNFLEILTSL